MSHPRTACSTSSTNLCAKCAPLYTHLRGHIPADRLNCPSLTTYPIHLKIRIRPATNAAEVQEIHNICRDIARVMTPQVQNMFGLAPGTPVPMAGRKEFRREYTDLFILVDLPWEVDVSDWNVIDEILGVAGLIHTPEVAESERVMSFETSSTEINAVSCYPTPSSDGLDSPRPQEMPTRSDFPRTSDHRRVNGRNIQRQRKKAGARIKLDPIAKALLKGYNSKLNDEAIRKVLIAEACVLPPNLQALRSLSDQWHNNVSQGQHALGLPTEWVGIQAAWNYVKELEAKTLDPMAENIAYLLFHFNYKELCRRPKKYCPRPPNTHERSTTHVLNCIIEAAYPDDGFRGLEGDQLRRQLGYIIRKGQWCWQVVASLGSGVLLRGEWLDKMYVFTCSALPLTNPGI
jgi:hypothetical protein